MHKVDGILSHFLCDFLKATNACHKSKAFRETQKNPSVPLYPDRLAVAAYDKGYLRKNVTRPQIRRKIWASQRLLGIKSFSDYPLVCLSDSQLQNVLELSLKYEKRIDTNENTWPENEQLIKHEFEEYKMKGSYCNVDTKAIMENDRWISFFKYI